MTLEDLYDQLLPIVTQLSRESAQEHTAAIYAATTVGACWMAAIQQAADHHDARPLVTLALLAGQTMAVATTGSVS